MIVTLRYANKRDVRQLHRFALLANVKELCLVGTEFAKRHKRQYASAASQETSALPERHSKIRFISHASGIASVSAAR
jgi:hypothetical protein